PLSDSFDSQLLNPPGGTVAKYGFPGRISEVGAEHFRVIAPAVNSDPLYSGLSMAAVVDAWVRDVAFQDTQNTVTISNIAKQLTLDGVEDRHTLVHTSHAPADFALSRTRLLDDDSPVTAQRSTWR